MQVFLVFNVRLSYNDFDKTCLFGGEVTSAKFSKSSSLVKGRHRGVDLGVLNEPTAHTAIQLRRAQRRLTTLWT